MKSVLVGLALCAGLSAAPAGAESTALRGLETENEALAWHAIGRLDAQGIGFCTATLIDPVTVLTAAHCVYSKRTGEAIPAEGMTFRAGLRNGHAVAERSIAQVEPHPRYRPNRGIDQDNVRHDVALLRLEEPIPTHVVDPFVVAAGRIEPGPVSVVSYGRGRENVPSRQTECQMLGVQSDILTMDCNVTFGSSGAPVFSHLNGRGRIVSVVSVLGTIEGRSYSFGMALPKVVAELRDQMRANTQGPVATIRRLKVGGGDKSSIGAKFVRP